MCCNWQITDHNVRYGKAAVVAGLTHPQNNGLVEGHVNKLKLIKRMGYGRQASLCSVSAFSMLSSRKEDFAMQRQTVLERYCQLNRNGRVIVKEIRESGTSSLFLPQKEPFDPMKEEVVGKTHQEENLS